jgi:deoxyribodipyrimidine photo-lyase
LHICFYAMEYTRPITVFWFRRDLRLVDNNALFQALISGLNVLPVFIFDKNILKNLHSDDRRVSFIYQAIRHMNQRLLPYKASIQVYYGKPVEVFEQLLSTFAVSFVFANHDYEPYAIQRDLEVKKVLAERGVLFRTYKDQVIFERNEVTKLSGEPYTVFTPFSHKWQEKLNQNKDSLHRWNSEDYLFNIYGTDENHMVELAEIGFDEIPDVFHPFELNKSSLETYTNTRDYPALNNTSRVSAHLRFGTVSIRQLVSSAIEINATWLNELIWREFFMQILWHYPHVVDQPFRAKYRYINWLNNEKDFDAWCSGYTGYPLVDAGMRELNETGFMHNRVRMVTASFLVKHLLINWQWGEAYFADKLLDFELSSNNGNWQWAAGSGCDAAPYFRIFNPVTQAEKFDPESIYINRWVPEYSTQSYFSPMVEHSFARTRCLAAYKACI